MSGQLESFLHAIREAPDDDVPRLVLADWLEDTGDPQRAEFIRTQIRLEDDVTPQERRTLESRADELLAANAPRWLGPLSQEPWQPVFRRGTPRMHAHTTTLIRNEIQQEAQRWFTPALVTELRTDGSAIGWWGKLAELPVVEELSGLIFAESRITQPDIMKLAGSPRLRNLRHLGLLQMSNPVRGIERDCMAALIESPHLARLTGLDLSLSPLTAESLRMLCHETPWLLTWLSLHSTPLAGDGLVLDLLRARWLPCLTTLSVNECISSPLELQRLVRGLAPTRLRYLCLSKCEVGDDEAALVADSPHLSELREVWLAFPKFTKEGALALADSPYLDKLRLLYVYPMNPDTPEARILRWRFGGVVQFEWLARRE
jgi:uncharacterized protein (TIGR02996 family)